MHTPIDTLHVAQLVSRASAGKHGIVFTLADPHPFSVGQVIAVTTSVAVAPRLYSICSGERDPGKSFLFTVKSQGELTPLLANCRAGDSLLVSRPTGTFSIPIAESSCWIAAGTGIAPFRAFLRTHDIFPDMHLIYGAKTPEHFHFLDELSQHIPSGRLTLCASRSAAPNLFHGRLTHWLRQSPDLPVAQRYVLCGSAEMVVEVRDILLSRGITLSAISAEIYF